MERDSAVADQVDDDIESSRFLEFLTPEDRRTLSASADARRYRRGAVVLEQGAASQTLFVIVRGAVSIAVEHDGHSVTVATLQADQVFGEQSFLEGTPASASVIAAVDDTIVLALEPRHLQSLLQSVPGLAARYYHSLATQLSRRLRATTAQIPRLLADDISQIERRSFDHASRHDDDVALPPTIVRATTDFKTIMADAEVALLKGRIDPAALGPVVAAACESLNHALQHHVRDESRLADAIGSYVFRETFPFFMSSRFIERCYTKPRGYAGDFGTIDMIYAGETAGMGRLGKFVDDWAMTIPASRAVANRRSALVGRLEERLAAWASDAPMPVASLASGPARELFDLFERHPERAVAATCVDIDPEALAHVARTARSRAVTQSMHYIRGSLIRMAVSNRTALPGPQWLIYSCGLTDYLQDASVIAILDWAHGWLMPGGQLVIGNFSDVNPNKAFMDYVGEWVLRHRSADELQDLFALSKFRNAPITIDRDASGVQLFATGTKI